jgi:hypothetical protein
VNERHGAQAELAGGLHRRREELLAGVLIEGFVQEVSEGHVTRER